MVRLLELERGPDEAIRADQVLQEIEKIRSLSPALWARAIDGFPRYVETFEAYRSAFLAEGASPRHAEQIATLAAGRDLLVADYVPEADALAEEVKRWMALVQEARDEEAEGEGVQCLNHLLTAPADSWRAGDRKTVSELILEAREHAGVESGRALEGIGLKLLNWNDPATIVLLVANQYVGLERIFKETRWAGGLWRDALLYQVGTRWIGPAQRFAGVQQRSTMINREYLPMKAGAEAADGDQSGDDEAE